MMAERQVAFLFQEAGGLTAHEIGGKAASLVAMTRMGLPVPPGFVVTTGVCRAFLEHGAFPVRLAWQVERCVKALERQSGKRFGGTRDPLLVSVRSGAPVSMPGMMDTILNLGMTPKCLPALGKKMGTQFAADTWGRFRNGFQKIVGRAAPDDVREQLALALTAVCRSWQNPRACEYRKAHGIPDSMGTAVTVQSMVFGNLDCLSGTGVVFSRNVATGEPELYGEFLPCAQGEDVVGGGVTPLPITALAEQNPQAFRELAAWAGVLEAHYGDVVDIEFTLEAGRLWILQSRKAKRTPCASARFAVQSVWEGRLSKAEAVACVSEQEADGLTRPEFEKEALAKAAGNGQFFAKGLPAAPGAAVGKAAFTSARARELAARGEKVILLRPDTNPDDLPGMMASVAIVTATGGATSHAAVVARSLGIPAVVGLSGVSINGRAEAAGRTLREGDLCAVDGRQGLVLTGQVPMAPGVQSKEVKIFLKWLWAVRPPEPKPVPRWEALAREYRANAFLNDFYLADAMASASAGSALEFEAKKFRQDVVKEAAEILAAYLITAVAGELRHSWDRSDAEGSESLNVLHGRFGVNRRKYRRDAQVAVIDHLKNSTQEAWVEFLNLAVQVFSAAWRDGYGGAKWAAIAKAPLDLLEGRLKAAVFVDHVFDLRHNGGKLFDKHPMFSGKTSEDLLVRQLNLKKSAANIGALFEGLRQLYDSFSPGVMELWKKGKALGLWAKSQSAA